MMQHLLPYIEVVGVAAAVVVGVYLVLAILLRRRAVSVEILEIVGMVSSKVAMAIEQAHGHLSGPDKKRLAEDLVGEILSHLHINKAPRALVDASIEAAVLLVNQLTPHALDKNDKNDKNGEVA